MLKVRFKNDTTDSFLGHFLYSQVYPIITFSEIKKEVPWQKLSKKLINAYKDGGEYCQV